MDIASCSDSNEDPVDKLQRGQHDTYPWRRMGNIVVAICKILLPKLVILYLRVTLNYLTQYARMTV